MSAPVPAYRRRALLAAGAAWAALPLAGCGSLPPAASSRRQTASGAPLPNGALAARVHAADVVLLGELHDNHHHHAERGDLLASLAPAMLVAEHLPRGAEARLRRDVAGADLRDALKAAGFDDRGWGWPLHEPLFTAVAHAGHRLQGGNLPREAARQVVREGPQALPPELRRLLEAAPLDPAAQAALERDLLVSHCGRLPATRLPGMVWAQRGRDAAMVAALVGALAAARDGRTPAATVSPPVVLLAGNGHVRRDYGVPQLLRQLHPGLRLLTIGFAEEGGRGTEDAGLYDIVWTTPAVGREDPCAGMTAPASPRT